jgi:beta-phosphoglucomutase
MSKVKAVIFDMDGVLIDAREWHYEALNRALALFGYGISRYEHVMTLDGLPTRKKLELLSRDQGLPLGLHAIVNELKQAYTLEIVYAKCKPVFQHEYALSRLHGAGYRIAVASNSIRKTIEVMMDRAQLAGYLDALVSNEDVSHPKPDPEIYLNAASRLGIDPRECLIVEDNPHGIAAAKASGGHVMVVNEVWDVTWDAIETHIRMAEQEMR